MQLHFARTGWDTFVAQVAIPRRQMEVWFWLKARGLDALAAAGEDTGATICPTDRQPNASTDKEESYGTITAAPSTASRFTAINASLA